MREYDSTMKISAIKNDARETLVNEILEFLNEKYETVMKVASNEIGVVVGTFTDEDGFSHDIVDTVKVTTKSWYSKETGGRDVKEYDLFDEADNYAKEVEDKKNKKKKGDKENG